MATGEGAGQPDRLQVLNSVEMEVASALESAASVLVELGKEKPGKAAIDGAVGKFNESLQFVETNLNEQIQYLTKTATARAHASSSYGAQKDAEMSRQRLEMLQDRLDEMQRLHAEHGRTLPTRQSPDTPTM